MARTDAIDRGLSVPAEVKLERTVQRYEADTERIVAPNVLDVAERIERVRDDNKAFSEVVDTLKATSTKPR